MKSILIGFSVLVLVCVGTTAFSQSEEDAQREMAEIRAREAQINQQSNDYYDQQMERARQMDESGGGFSANPNYDYSDSTTSSTPGRTMAQ